MCRRIRELKSFTESHTLVSRRTADWIWSPYRAVVLKFWSTSEPPGIHSCADTHSGFCHEPPLWAASLRWRQRRRISLEFSSNDDIASGEATLSIILPRSTRKSPLLWRIGPGNPQATHDNHRVLHNAAGSGVIESRQWIFSSCSHCLADWMPVKKRPLHWTKSSDTSSLSQNIKKHEPFLKTVHSFLLMPVTLFLNLSAQR